MKYHKYILLVAVLLLAVLLFSGCSNNVSNDSWVVCHNYTGAFSEDGYYYTSNYGCLYFFDVTSNTAVCVCSKIACPHDSDIDSGSQFECEAYIGAGNFDGFYWDGGLYYVDNYEQYGPYLYRRNPDGSSLQRLMPLGHEYINENTAADVKTYFRVDDWLFYTLDLQSITKLEIGTEFATTNTLFMRTNLRTGRQEELLRVDASTALTPCAINNSYIIYSQLMLPQNSSEADRLENLRASKVQLVRMDLNTKERQVLIEKIWGDGLSVITVANDKIWYETTENEQRVCRTYDLKTGTDAHLYSIANLINLNADFGLRMDDETEEFYLVDMRTGKDLSTDLSKQTLYVNHISADGVVINRIVRGEGTSVKAKIYSYLTFKSLKDGLQETDFVDFWIKRNDSEVPPLAVINAQYLPAEVNNPDNLPVLQWLCFTYAGVPYAEDAAHEINRVLEEKEMPFRLQFVLLPQDSSGLEWFSSSAVQAALADVDLIFGDFTAELAKQYLMPITQYAYGAASPALQNAVPHEVYWNNTLYDGEVFGVPCGTRLLMGNGWAISDTVFSQFGLTEGDFNRQFWEMDEIFAKIYEKNNRKPFLWNILGIDAIGYSIEQPLMNYTPTAYNSPLGNHFQLIGSCFAIDYSTGTPTVVNYLATEYTRACQAALKRYNDAGYLTDDAAAYLVDYGNVFCDYTNYSSADNIHRIPVEELYFKAPVGAGTLCGISSTTKYKDEALMLLSLLANDEAFRELILFGVEGQDYLLTEYGDHMPLVRENGTIYDMTFLSPFSSLYGNANSLYLPTMDGSTKLETHQVMIDNNATQIPIYFDFSAVMDETLSINAILTRSKQEDKEKDPPILFARFGKLTEAEYDQMLVELKAAGNDTILAELQRQLDAWLAENPDWNK